MNSWQHVSSKLGNVRTETKQIAKELYDVARANGHEIWFMWGMGTSTEHRTGLALDLMVRNQAGGDFIRNYIWQNRARLRLRHVIWWQRITSTVNRPGVVRWMSDRGSVTNNHYDHIHVWFFSGAYQAPAAKKEEKPSENTTIVHKIQGALKVKTDGKWGRKTNKRAMRLRSASQSKRGFPANRQVGFDIKDVQTVIGTNDDGVWGELSQGALIVWIKQFQNILGVKDDGYWGPKTDTRFLTVRRRYFNKF